MALSKPINTSNLLKEKYPKVFALLDPNNNEGTDLDLVKCGSNRELNWKCTKAECDHHFWKGSPNAMYGGPKMTERKLEEPCPFCNGSRICRCTSLASVYPEILKIWDFDINDELGLDPYNIFPMSNTRAWFSCSKNSCGHHKWSSSIGNIYQFKSDCPWCAGRKYCSCGTIAGKRPDLLQSWNKEENDKRGLDPYEITYLSWDPAVWNCLDHTTCQEHVYEASISNVCYRNDKCPWCTHRNGKVCKCDCFPTARPEMFKDFKQEENKGIDPYKLSIGSGKKINWVGHECGHRWTNVLGNRIKRNTGCPTCRIYKLETKCANVLDKIQDNYNIKHSAQKIFENCVNESSGRRLKFDRYIEGFKYKICVELDGQQHFEDVYFNGKTSDLEIVRFRDRIKTMFCLANHIHFLRISYSEIDNMEDHIIEFFRLVKEYEADENCETPAFLFAGKEYKDKSYQVFTFDN